MIRTLHHSALSILDRNAVVLDLGCGRGSFHYGTYPFRTIAMDVSLPASDLRQSGAHIEYVAADSMHIPLAEHSIDMVVSHNTMEHFPDYQMTLSEVGRVLKPNGFLWIAVPNGYGLDDALYRLIFAGGGHVNRFTPEGLTKDVFTLAGLPLQQSCALFSGFVYLKKPDPRELEHFPPAARAIDNVPVGFLNTGVVALNTLTRVTDKLFGTRLSQYGWGFMFSRHDAPGPLLSCFNVCRRCGSGISAEALLPHAGKSIFGLRLYGCPHCGERNVLVPPVAGTI